LKSIRKGPFKSFLIEPILFFSSAS
jgi:hypothetical protein